MSRSAAGFTLLEVMLAMVIMALVSGLIYAGLRQSLDGWHRLQRNDTSILEGAMAEAFVRELFSQAVPMLHRQANGSMTGATGSSTEFEFAALVPRIRHIQGVYAVRLSFHHSRQETQLILEYAPWRDPQSILEVARLPVVDALRAGQFEYFDDEGKRWQKTWNVPSKLPSCVRLSLVLDDGTKEAWAMRIPVTGAAAENGPES